MKYFNNICLDCRNNKEKNNTQTLCSVEKTENPMKIFDYSIEDQPLATVDATTYDVIEKCCYNFDDRHELPRDVYCDYGKYGDEMGLLNRLTRIVNNDMGFNEFEGALLDFLRNNVNQRIDKEKVD